jgi:hypothetical protein
MVGAEAAVVTIEGAGAAVVAMVWVLVGDGATDAIGWWEGAEVSCSVRSQEFIY